MSESPSGYPILLNLQDKPVAVVGGGPVAARKVEHLLKAGARVLLISPAITRAMKDRFIEGAVHWIQSSYQRDIFNEYMPILVIAATDDARVNQTVAQDAHRIRALCNVANGSHEDSDFSNMARIDQPPLTVALSTSGESPALLRLLKAKLAEEIGEEYGILADWLGSLRRDAHRANGSQADRQALYERVLDSEALSLLRAGNLDQARLLFDRIVQREAAK